MSEKTVNYLDLTSESFFFIQINRHPVVIKKYILKNFPLYEILQKELGEIIKFNYYIGMTRSELKKDELPIFAVTSLFEDRNRILKHKADSKIFRIDQKIELFDYLAFPYNIFEPCERDILVYTGPRLEEKQITEMVEKWKQNTQICS